MTEEIKEDFSVYLGRNVGSYHLGQLIGSGGMGAVFLATHNILHKRVALKLLREHHRKDTETARGFFAEAKAAAGTGHENVIQVFDVDEDPVFGPFMVMEYLSSSESLASVIRKEGALSFSRIRKITLQIAGALSATHARGVVHCDLKPSNILLIHALGQSDVVKLIDFGIAKTINAKQPSQGPKIVRGTPKYMSPEQVAGKNLDGRSDEYSLGILVYLMIAGVSPFSTGSPAETMRKQYYDPPPPVREKRGDLPLAAEEVLLKALEKKPENRYPDILQFAQALSDALPPETKTADKMLPPLMIEEFASKDQEMFDGPSLIHLQPVPVASPSDATGDLGPVRRTLPRLAIVQPPAPNEYPAEGMSLFSSPGKHPEDPSGSMPKLAPISAPVEPEPSTLGYGGIFGSPEVPAVVPEKPKSVPSSPFALNETADDNAPMASPLSTQPFRALGGGGAFMTPPKNAPPAPNAAPPKSGDDPLAPGKSWSAMPVVSQDNKPIESPSAGPYNLTPIASVEPTAEPAKDPKAKPKKEPLLGPKHLEGDDDEPSLAPYWLSFFLLVGCFVGWCYLSGFFGGFVLAKPASAPPASASAPASKKSAPESQPAKPVKEKKKKKQSN